MSSKIVKGFLYQIEQNGAFKGYLCGSCDFTVFDLLSCSVKLHPDYYQKIEMSDGIIVDYYDKEEVPSFSDSSIDNIVKNIANTKKIPIYSLCKKEQIDKMNEKTTVAQAIFQTKLEANDLSQEEISEYYKVLKSLKNLYGMEHGNDLEMENLSKMGWDVETYQDIFLKYNIQLADLIDKQLQTYGIFFICIGAGRLVGEWSINEILIAKYSYNIKRVLL